MTAEDIIIHIFYLVATSLADIPRHSQARLYSSELITIGILFSLQCGFFRVLYRWLKRNYDERFGDETLPDRAHLPLFSLSSYEKIDIALASMNCQPVPLCVYNPRSKHAESEA